MVLRVPTRLLASRPYTHFGHARFSAATARGALLQAPPGQPRRRPGAGARTNTMAGGPSALGVGNNGTSNHVPPPPSPRGAARDSTPQQKSQDTRSDDWSPRSTTRSPLPSDFGFPQVFNLLTECLPILLCITMPNVAPFLLVVWNEPRARPTQALWNHGPCPPRYCAQPDLLLWWTTLEAPEAIGHLRGPDGQLWLLIEHRHTCWASQTHCALADGLPAGEIPRRRITRRWWSAVRAQGTTEPGPGPCSRHTNLARP